jgi:hypothetical protein
MNLRHDMATNFAIVHEPLRKGIRPTPSCLGHLGGIKIEMIISFSRCPMQVGRVKSRRDVHNELPQSTQALKVWRDTQHSAGHTDAKGGSITVPLTSCLTGLESAVWQLTMFVFICLTDKFKPVKKELNGTVILPPLRIPCLA